MLINTSFNVSGRPLLNRAETAIEILTASKMDGVWLNGWFYSTQPCGIDAACAGFSSSQSRVAAIP